MLILTYPLCINSIRHIFDRGLDQCVVLSIRGQESKMSSRKRPPPLPLSIIVSCHLVSPPICHDLCFSHQKITLRKIDFCGRAEGKLTFLCLAKNFVRKSSRAVLACQRGKHLVIDEALPKYFFFFEFLRKFFLDPNHLLILFSNLEIGQLLTLILVWRGMILLAKVGCI